jgi:hypothetical protein
MFRGRSSDLQAHSYLPDFPGLSSQCLFGVRTCLPLRGSSGFAPDSLFISRRRENHRSETHYILSRISVQPNLLWISSLFYYCF